VTIDEIIDDIETLLTARGLRSKLLHWDINEDRATGVVVLDRIQVKDEFRGQGYARETLRVFTDYCDEHNLDAELTVRPLTDRTAPRRLRKLYGIHGFRAHPRRENVMFRPCKRNAAPP
jgi:GNAT superfamily N-acetyltransferase